MHRYDLFEASYSMQLATETSPVVRSLHETRREVFSRPLLTFTSALCLILCEYGDAAARTQDQLGRTCTWYGIVVESGIYLGTRSVIV
jgi:hypothetical protein